MIRTVLQIGDPKLKKLNQGVIDFKAAATVVQDLVDTMRSEDAIGVAATQIGENFRIFITEPRETQFRSGNQVDILRVYINPKITELSKKTVEIYEGCASVCHGTIFAPVVRPSSLTITAYDLDGKKFQFVTDGILARVIQHEYDHLDGIEFTEKIFDHKRILAREHYLAQLKHNQIQKLASEIHHKEMIYLPK